MLRLSFAAAVGLVVACGAPPKPAPPVTPPPAAPPVSALPALDPPEPSLRLPRNFWPTGYRARLAIDPAMDDFRGSIEIAGEIRERSQRLWLHGRGLRIASAVATQNGREIRVDVAPVGDDLLSLRPAEPLEIGAVTLAIDYTGAYNTAGVDGIYKMAFDGISYVETKFEAITARRAFPCFDEPDNKVPWQLTLDVPAALVALANTKPAAEVAVDATTKRIVFAPTRPLPSYLVAFAVGPFELVDAGTTSSGVATRIAALSGRAHEATYAAQTANKILALLEDYFGTPYPYDKLDHISRPHPGRGALENPGLISYGKSLVLVDPEKRSFGDRAAWVNTAAHEMAHQWFGNSVTMMWWDDLWLNEALADWIGDKILAAFEPAWRSELFTIGELGRALTADSLVSARSVRQPIQSPGDILLAFDSITYSKGARLLAMFEHVVGPDKFRDGVRAYLGKHKDGNATAADFFAAISKVAGRDIEPAFRTFLDQPGAPVVHGELRCDAGAPPRLALRQSRYVLPGSPPPAEGRPWHLPVCVAFDQSGARAEACTELTAATGELVLDSKTCPGWWHGNAGGHGYYRTTQAERAVIALRDRGWSQLTEAERMVAYSDVAAFVRADQLGVALQMTFVPKLLAQNHRFAVGAAVGAIYGIRPLLRPDQRARLDRWIRAAFGASARALSWTAQSGETIDTESARLNQVPLVAWAGDPRLRAQAVALAANWRALGTTRRAILSIAADADPATFDRILAAAPIERDDELRSDLLSALADVTDPARLRRALALAFDPRLTVLDAEGLVYGGQSATYPVQAAYFREHIDRLLARYPNDGTADATWLAAVFTRSCDPTERDATVAFITERFAGRTGGARIVANAIERLDQCIARKALLRPKIAAWLATQR